jgi:hypothetical protein
MNELARRMEPYRLRAKRYRNHAVEARAQGGPDAAGQLFDRAAHTLREAIGYLEGLGVPDPRATDPATGEEVEIARQLADCWGMLGGIHRTAGDLDAARVAYDRGAEYESTPRFRILNTYNQVNGLVIRILAHPEFLSRPGGMVDDVPGQPPQPMGALLARAADEIQRQLDAGREDIPWALADLALVRVLGGLDGVDSAVAALDRSSPVETFPFESALKVVRELAECGLPMRSALESLAARYEAAIQKRLAMQG